MLMCRSKLFLSPIVFALDADNFLSAAYIDNDSREPSSIDAARVEALGVFFDIETTLGVVSVYSNGALG